MRRRGFTIGVIASMVCGNFPRAIGKVEAWVTRAELDEAEERLCRHARKLQTVRMMKPSQPGVITAQILWTDLGLEMIRAYADGGRLALVEFSKREEFKA